MMWWDIRLSSGTNALELLKGLYFLKKSFFSLFFNWLVFLGNSDIGFPSILEDDSSPYEGVVSLL